jgi:phosphate/sulfate permease
MGDPYILMLVALAVLAIVDLVVGVSNDAVNFLNSAIGSKAISVRNIMIIASLGVFFGAIFLIHSECQHQLQFLLYLSF